METFSRMSPDQFQACGFEIAALGTKGINPNNFDRNYTLRTLPGKFNGRQLLSYMYVALKQAAPHLDMEFDLSAEYQEAQQFFGKPED